MKLPVSTKSRDGSFGDFGDSTAFGDVFFHSLPPQANRAKPRHDCGRCRPTADRDRRNHRSEDKLAAGPPYQNQVDRRYLLAWLAVELDLNKTLRAKPGVRAEYYSRQQADALLPCLQLE